ncbi:NAD(P)/FAD-dependent oxidoreductase [Dorea acetigenes]|uniref:NAD(P)/FAD-dependent oxidoreductase n=1 Tax=Dorea acetigenes TaxID=2981787 RepID=A0ABT2RRX4_9FIRM|nr:NAD(P)/FAD-dependent oxidoreductase [Dorea acetigenes]MCU6688157.1 NAD(P)/FAD-dependent oxidoreductase [Dorea acetigenes]SCJ67544.1 ribulose-1%2C5-biphosphate synthetase [uncultured Clostridium sp.]
MNQYDVIIIGAGPSGIFCAYELIKERPDLKILMIEKGRSIEQRNCPKRKTKVCVGCKPCSITTGFAGAGAFSDGKLSLSPDVGGTLPEILGYEKTAELIQEADRIYLQFGADEKVYGVEDRKAIEEIRTKAIRANLKLIECPIRHLGTEEGYKIYTRLQEHLLSSGVEILFMTMVKDIIVENGIAKGVITEEGDSYYAPEIVAGIGREGSEWFSHVCREHGIGTKNGTVDVGVRVEVRDEIMKELNEKLYEAKLVYYTPTFDDKVRVFCTNPSGEVATEYYDNGLAVVNGHAYKSKDLKTNNTNFALLVSKNFTEPFKTPIEYGKHIAQLGNMLSGGKILLQRYGDFRRGRRTTQERLLRNNIVPTLKDAVPGDLSLVFPHRIMVAIDEMIQALDKVTPGIASDETLLYGVEVKFYSNKVIVNKEFETNIKGLRVMGDGASITRGLQQASANGLFVARCILFCQK